MNNDKNEPVTSDDALEAYLDDKRAHALYTHHVARIQKLEWQVDQAKQLQHALAQLKVALATHSCAQEAWDNFVVILMLVDPNAKQYIDKLK